MSEEKARMTVRQLMTELLKSEDLDAEVSISFRGSDGFGVSDLTFSEDENIPTIVTD